MSEDTATNIRFEAAVPQFTVPDLVRTAEYYRDVLIPRRQRIVALTQIEHNAMVAGFFQLIQARQNEASAGRDYIDAQHDYWIARTNLDRALNGIPEKRQGGQ